MNQTRLLISLMLVFASAVVVAQAGETGWTLRMYGVMAGSSAETRMGGAGIATRVDAGGGLGVGGEYRVSERLGLEVSTFFAGLDMEAALRRNGLPLTESLELGMVPLTLGMTFHLNPERRTDVFVAPTLSYVSYFELETRYRWEGSTVTVEDSSDMAVGAALGVDVPFGQGKWAVCTGLRYMKTDAKEADVDPLIVTLGFARSF